MARRSRQLAATCALFVATIAAPGCAEDGGGDPSAAAGARALERDYEAVLARAPAPLAELYAEGDALLPGGLDTYRERIAGLRGYPVVVNVWASWCGPCRAEFPHFQRQAAEHGAKVAFLGVDSQDSEDAASTFLEDYPLPYPSVFDPDEEVQRELGLVGLPGTAFLDRDGELVHLKQGPYTSEDDLAADIERYAG